MKRALFGSLLLHGLLLSLLGFSGSVPAPVSPVFSVALLPVDALAVRKSPQAATARPPPPQDVAPARAKAGSVAPAMASPGKQAAAPLLTQRADVPAPAVLATQSGGTSARQEAAPGPAVAAETVNAAGQGKAEKAVANHGLQIRFRPKPAYPALSRELGEEGVVMLRLTVNAASQLEQVQVVRSSGFVRLDRAARDGVSRWRFEAAIQEGQAVGATMELPVHFKLDEL